MLFFWVYGFVDFVVVVVVGKAVVGRVVVGKVVVGKVVVGMVVVGMVVVDMVVDTAVGDRVVDNVAEAFVVGSWDFEWKVGWQQCGGSLGNVVGILHVQSCQPLVLSSSRSCSQTFSCYQL